jgi:alpha/beta superfamily hydrolase
VFQVRHKLASSHENRNGKRIPRRKKFLAAGRIAVVTLSFTMPPQPHRTLMIPGPAGQIETLLWSPLEQHAGHKPPLAAVVCHPHPLFGGTMHNKVVYQTAKTIHRFGLPVARFNFRGVGSSEGTHDNGAGEALDVLAVIDFLAQEYPETPLLVAGFSFGSWVGLRAGCGDARVTELIGLGLPVGDLDHRGFAYLDTCDKPKLLVTGEFDRFGPPHKLREMVERFPAHVQQKTRVAIVRGGDHFFTGHLTELDREITKWMVEQHPELAREI